MVSGLFGRLARVRVTLTYGVILTGVTAAMVTLGPRAQDEIVRHASTNLHNLSHGRFGTLLGSAFVVDAGPIYVWLPGLVCLLALAELLWGSGRLVVAFAVGHVGTTVLVALGLTAAIELQWLPWSLTRATDVGMSYGAAAVVGSLTAAIPRRWRPAWLGWWLAVAVAVVALGHDFTDVGHVVALGLGIVMSTRFRHPARWTLPACVLLGIGGSFGYLVLSNTAMLVATASGLLGALAGEILRRTRASSTGRDPDCRRHPADSDSPAKMHSSSSVSTMSGMLTLSLRNAR